VAWLRKWWRWLIGPGIIVLAAGAGWFIPTGDFLVMPGEAVRTSSMISVSSAPQPKTRRGELLLLTVYSGPASADEWIFGHVWPNARVVPAHTQLPPNTTYERFRRLEESMMADSQTAAKVVALRQLGYEVPERGEGAVVQSVQRGSAAESVGIKKDDLILAVNGQAVHTAGELVERLGELPPGEQVKLTMKTGESEAEQELEVRLGSRPNQPSRSFLGVTPVTFRQRFDFPVEIRIDAKGIVGPSAGLVLGLGIIQTVGGQDLTHGHRVAATGTLDIDGHVGAVGGIEDKVLTADARAEYLLVPGSDYDKARSAGRKAQIVKVDTIQQALEFLTGLA
jgi:PDZ domain-containing protein